MKLAGNLISLCQSPILTSAEDVEYDILETDNSILRVESNNCLYDLHPLNSKKFTEFLDEHKHIKFSEKISLSANAGVIINHGIFTGKNDMQFLVTDAFGGFNCLAFMNSEFIFRKNHNAISVIDLFSIVENLALCLLSSESTHGYISSKTVIINEIDGIWHGGIICLADEFYSQLSSVPAQTVENFYKQLRQFSYGYAYRKPGGGHFGTIVPTHLGSEVDSYALAMIALQLFSRNTGFQLHETEVIQKKALEDWLNDDSILDRHSEMFRPEAEGTPEYYLYQTEYEFYQAEIHEQLQRLLHKNSPQDFYDYCSQTHAKLKQAEDDRIQVEYALLEKENYLPSTHIEFYETIHPFCQTIIPYLKGQEGRKGVCQHCNRSILFPLVPQSKAYMEKIVYSYDDDEEATEPKTRPGRQLQQQQQEQDDEEGETINTDILHRTSRRDTVSFYRRTSRVMTEELDVALLERMRREQEPIKPKQRPLSVKLKKLGENMTPKALKPIGSGLKALSKRIAKPKIEDQDSEKLERVLITPKKHTNYLPLYIAAGCVVIFLVVFSFFGHKSPQKKTGNGQAPVTTPSKHKSIVLLTRVYYPDYHDIANKPPELHIELKKHRVDKEDVSKIKHYIDTTKVKTAEMNFCISRNSKKVTTGSIPCKWIDQRGNITVEVDKYYMDATFTMDQWQKPIPIVIGALNANKFADRTNIFVDYIKHTRRFSAAMKICLDKAQMYLIKGDEAEMALINKYLANMKIPQYNLWKLPFESMYNGLQMWPQSKFKGDLWIKLKNDWQKLDDKLKLIVD